MRTMKNKKTKAILSLSGYLLMLIALCVAVGFIFHSSYYELIYVSGASMSPTLNGGETESEVDGTLVDFGIVDNHQSAINHIKRFDIVSTYYPDDYNSNGEINVSAKRKIKRVIALPGETFTIKDGLLSVKKGEEFESVPYTFKVVESKTKDIEAKTLGENEYWVLGDNRANSLDCGATNKPINKKDIVGVLVAIEGRATLKLKNYVCKICGKKYKSNPASCQDGCPGYITAQYNLSNKQYIWPKYF